jgi:hypothetical protein
MECKAIAIVIQRKLWWLASLALKPNEVAMAMVPDE